MNKRIAIGAVVALLASLAFATVASASDGFEDGDYTIFLPGADPVEFTITDGAFAADNPFSDDDGRDEIRITSGAIEIEVDADDAKIEISGLSPEEAAQVTVAFGESVYSQENLPEDWEIVFDDDALSDDDDSIDDDAISEDDDSESVDDDALSDDDDSVDDDDSDSDDTQTTTATIDDDSDDDTLSEDDDSESVDDDALSDDDDSVDGDDSDSDDAQTTTATIDDDSADDDDSVDDDSADDDSIDDDDSADDDSDD